MEPDHRSLWSGLQAPLPPQYSWRPLNHLLSRGETNKARSFAGPCLRTSRESYFVNCWLGVFLSLSPMGYYLASDRFSEQDLAHSMLPAATPSPSTGPHSLLKPRGRMQGTPTPFWQPAQ